jgi:hypothetical protein
MAEELGTVHTHGRVMVGSRTKVIFSPDGSTSPGNYGWLLAFQLGHIFKGYMYLLLFTSQFLAFW